MNWNSEPWAGGTAGLILMSEIGCDEANSVLENCKLTSASAMEDLAAARVKVSICLHYQWHLTNSSLSFRTPFRCHLPWEAFLISPFREEAHRKQTGRTKSCLTPLTVWSPGWAEMCLQAPSPITTKQSAEGFGAETPWCHNWYGNLPINAVM